MKITDLAIDNIKKHLADNPGKHLRIQAVEGGCAGMMYNMGLDDKKGDDVVIKVKDIEILTDKKSEELMSEATIDYDKEEDGFKIDNPKAQSGCSACPGCH